MCMCVETYWVSPESEGGGGVARPSVSGCGILNMRSAGPARPLTSPVSVDTDTHTHARTSVASREFQRSRRPQLHFSAALF